MSLLGLNLLCPETSSIRLFSSAFLWAQSSFSVRPPTCLGFCYLKERMKSHPFSWYVPWRLLTCAPVPRAPCACPGCGWQSAWSRAAGFQPRRSSGNPSSRFPAWHGLSSPGAEPRSGQGCCWDFRGEDCPHSVVREHRVLLTALCVRPSCPSCALDYDEDRTRVAENPGGPLFTGAGCTLVPVLVFMASLWAGTVASPGLLERLSLCWVLLSGCTWADCGAQVSSTWLLSPVCCAV